LSPRAQKSTDAFDAFDEGSARARPRRLKFTNEADENRKLAVMARLNVCILASCTRSRPSASGQKRPLRRTRESLLSDHRRHSIARLLYSSNCARA